MDKAGIVLLAIVGMLAWVTFWIWLGLFGLSVGGKAVEPVSSYIRTKLLSWAKWLNHPKNAGTALQWGVRIVAVAAIFFALQIDRDNWLDDYRGEIAGIAFTVLVIEEVSRLRVRQEYKQSIIRQMASRSNDFALDAARIAMDEGWLNDGSLKGADLRGAHLKGAVLFNADIKEATHLVEAIVFNANPKEVTHLEGSVLRGAHLEKADLRGVHLEEADLFNADLKGADLRGAHLEKADLRDAHLEEAILLEAHLEEAKLSGAHLEDATLSRAHLEGTELLYTHLERSKLLYAHLEGADLREAHLEGAVLIGTRYNNKTVWPDGFKPPPDAINVDDPDYVPPPEP